MLRFKKSLGQHFLKKVPKSLYTFLEDGINTSAEKILVIEIGPGDGALTYPAIKFLEQRVQEYKKQKLHKDVYYVGIEVDKRRKFAVKSSLIDFEILYADVLQVSLEMLIQKAVGKKSKQHNTDMHLTQLSATNCEDNLTILLFGSLPYYISKDIILKFSQEICSVSTKCNIEVLFWYLIQKEVAESFLAKSPNATLIGNYLQLFVQRLQKQELLKPQEFIPAPKVDSLVITGQYKRFSTKLATECHAFDMLKQCMAQFFRFKRKTIRKTLKVLGLYKQFKDSKKRGKQTGKQMGKQIEKGIDVTSNGVVFQDRLQDILTKRPQELTLTEWQLLCKKLRKEV